jgi:hypothetical protein
MQPNSRCPGWSDRPGGIGIAAFAWIAFTVGAACSSSGTASHDAAAGGGAGGTDAAADGAGSGADASADASAWTCQQVRLCAFQCTSDTCISTCAAHGSAAAQAAFQTVNDCTASPEMGGCAETSDPNYRNCLCLAQCLEDPPCAATLDPCLGNIDDTVCDACDS